MRHSVAYFVIGSSIFFFFVLFSYLVHENLLNQLDFNTMVRLQDKLPRRVDPIFSWFSIFGNFEVMLVFLGVLLVAYRKIIGGVVAFSAFVSFHLIEIFGKVMVEHPPPPQFMLRTEHPVDFPQFHVRSEFSYPSGHSGRTVFIAVLLGFFIYRSSLPLPVKLVLLSILTGYVIIMIISRIYLGEHWMSDVFGGAFLGLALGLISLSFLQKSRPTLKKREN
jgi:undecaprenyl-diphosphatase